MNSPPTSDGSAPDGSHGAVTRVLKMKLTPFEAGLKETFKWYVRNHKPRTSGFEFDDKVLALAKTGSPLSV